MSPIHTSLLASTLFITSFVPAQPGTPDPSFGNGGIVTLDFTSGSNEIAWGVAVQPDGKVVLVGSQGTLGPVFAVARLEADGDPDPAFSGDGRLTTDLDGSMESARAVAVQPDGKIVVVGHARPSLDQDIAVVRYHPDGTLDNTFDGDGKVYTDIDEDDRALDVLVQPDGRILVAGYTENENIVRFVVVRYTTTGSPDPSFGGGTGHVQVSFLPQDNAVAWALALRSDGKIIVAGYAHNGTDQDVAVARLNVDGSLDTGFDGDGKVVTQAGPVNEYGYSVVVQDDDRIVVGGYSDIGGGEHFIAVRYTDDGTLDTTFDGDGMVETNISGYDQAFGMVLQPDGRIVLAGHSHNGSDRDFSSVRYDTDGSLDETYDDDGMMTLPIGAGTGEQCYAAALAPDGDIVLAGFMDGPNAADFVAAKLGSGLNLGMMDRTLIAQNMLVYPDPIVDRATLVFELRTTITLSCEVLDANGRVVRSLFSSKTFPAGRHQHMFELAGLGRGTYTIRLDHAAGATRIAVVEL